MYSLVDVAPPRVKVVFFHSQIPQNVTSKVNVTRYYPPLVFNNVQLIGCGTL